MQPAANRPSVLARLESSDRVHLRSVEVLSSPVFMPQQIHFRQLTAIVGSHAAGKSYLLKILEESLPKYGNELMRFPPASRSRWRQGRNPEATTVTGVHCLEMGSNWKPQEVIVDLAGFETATFTYSGTEEGLDISVSLSAHRAFGEYQMWMQDIEEPDHAEEFQRKWSANKSALNSINRILGRSYKSMKFSTFKRTGNYDAPYLEATMPDGQVRTPFQMSAGELWVLYCIWEPERAVASDVFLIDEPECYLSPRGHVAFLDETARRTLDGVFQTIISTHSETMIRRLPAALLRFTVRGGQGAIVRDDES